MASPPGAPSEATAPAATTDLLEALRAAGEPTRLRILALIARTELTVSELTQILRQSQPRVSRHLKLLNNAGLLERHQEGAWVFYRLADQGGRARVARTLVELIPQSDPEGVRDAQRLDAVRAVRARRATSYFRAAAAQWDRIRSLYVDEARVERAMLAASGKRPITEMVDLGTGTGRILQVFSERIGRGIGIDMSREMLGVARANLEKDGLAHCQVRMGDIYNVPLPDGSVDLATLHHVLHFLDEPAAVVAEAARLLRAGGRLLVVDFAPHGLEFLRTEHAHRRLGFADAEIIGWCRRAGLGPVTVKHLRPPAAGAGERLTVSVWCARRRGGAAAERRLQAA